MIIKYSKYIINIIIVILILELSLQIASRANQYLFSITQDQNLQDGKKSIVILGDCFTLEPNMMGNTYPDVLERKIKDHKNDVNIINDSFLYASSINIYDKLQDRIDFLKRSKTKIAISMIPSLLVNDTYYFPFKKNSHLRTKYNLKIIHTLEILLQKYKIYSLLPDSYVIKKYIRFYKEEKIREGLDLSLEIKESPGKGTIGKLGEAWFNLYLYIRLKDNLKFQFEKKEAQANAQRLFLELAKEDQSKTYLDDILIGLTLSNHTKTYEELEDIVFLKEMKEQNPSLYFLAINQYYRINNNITLANSIILEAFATNPKGINIIEAIISTKIAMKDYDSANLYFKKLEGLSSSENTQFQLSHNYFMLIQKTLENNGIKHIALTHPDQNLDTLKKLYNNNKKIDYVDLASIFEVRKDNVYSRSMYPFVNYGLQEDEVTIQGHKLIAEKIYEALKDNL